MTSAQALDAILADLKRRQVNAARRNKPTMWAYYLSTRRALVRWFGPSRKEGGVAGKSLALIQCAERHYGDRCAVRAAHWAALAVYARRILREWCSDKTLRREDCGSLDWLRQRAEED